MLIFGATSGALLLFLAMVRLVADPGVVPDMDLRVQQAIASILSPGTIRFMVAITSLGGVTVMTILTLLLAAVFWRHRCWVYLVELLVAVPLGAVVISALKAFFQRTRPPGAVIEVGGLSFPSGHAFISIVFFGFIIRLLLRSRLHPAWIAGGTVLSALLIVLIGMSRVYLGVHFLTDVLGGYAAGFLWLLLALQLVRAVRGTSAFARP